MNSKHETSHSTWSDALTAAKLTDIVQGIFNDFILDRTQALLDRFDTQVELNLAGNPRIVPFAGKHAGTRAVVDLLDLLAKTIRVKTIESGDFRIDETEVSHELYAEAFVLETGKVFYFRGTINWKMSPEHRVLYMQQLGDTGSMEAAFKK